MGKAFRFDKSRSLPQCIFLFRDRWSARPFRTGQRLVRFSLNASRDWTEVFITSSVEPSSPELVGGTNAYPGKAPVQ